MWYNPTTWFKQPSTSQPKTPNPVSKPSNFSDQPSNITLPEATKPKGSGGGGGSSSSSGSSLAGNTGTGYDPATNSNLPSTPAGTTTVTKPAVYYSTDPNWKGSDPNSITIYIDQGGRTTGQTSAGSNIIPKGINVSQSGYVDGKYIGNVGNYIASNMTMTNTTPLKINQTNTFTTQNQNSEYANIFKASDSKTGSYGVPLLNSPQASKVNNFQPYWLYDNNQSFSQAGASNEGAYSASINYNPVKVPAFAIDSSGLNFAGMGEPKGTSFTAWQQIKTYKDINQASNEANKQFQTNPLIFENQSGFSSISGPLGTVYKLDTNKYLQANRPEIFGLGYGSPSYKFAEAKFNALPYQERVKATTAGAFVGGVQFGIGTADFAKSITYNLKNAGFQTYDSNNPKYEPFKWEWKTLGGFENIRSAPSTPYSLLAPQSLLKSPEGLTTLALVAGTVYQGAKGFVTSYKSFKGLEMPVNVPNANLISTQGSLTTGQYTKVTRLQALDFAGAETLNNLMPIKLENNYWHVEKIISQTSLGIKPQVSNRAYSQGIRTDIVNGNAILSTGKSGQNYGELYNFNAVKITPRLFGNSVITTANFQAGSLTGITASSQFITKPSTASKFGMVTEEFNAGTREYWLVQQYAVENKFGYEPQRITQRYMQNFGKGFDKNLIVNKVSITKGGISKIQNTERYSNVNDMYILEGKPYGAGISGRPYTATGRGVSKEMLEITDLQGNTIKEGIGLSKLTSGGRTTNVPFDYRYITPKSANVINYNLGGGGTRVDNVANLITNQAKLENYASKTVPNLMIQKIAPLNIQMPKPVIKYSQATSSGLMLSSFKSTTLANNLKSINSKVVMPTTKTIVTPISISRITSVTRTTSTSISQLVNLPVTTITPIVPPVTNPVTYKPQTPVFPFVFPFPFSGDIDFGKANRIYKGKQRTKYVPSYEALVFGVKGKVPKGIETGARIRPIPKGYSWAFNKVKLKGIKL